NPTSKQPPRAVCRYWQSSGRCRHRERGYCKYSHPQLVAEKQKQRGREAERGGGEKRSKSWTPSSRKNCTETPPQSPAHKKAQSPAVSPANSRSPSFSPSPVRFHARERGRGSGGF